MGVVCARVRGSEQRFGYVESALKIELTKRCLHPTIEDKGEKSTGGDVDPDDESEIDVLPKEIGKRRLMSQKGLVTAMCEPILNRTVQYQRTPAEHVSRREMIGADRHEVRSQGGV